MSIVGMASCIATLIGLWLLGMAEKGSRAETISIIVYILGMIGFLATV